MVTRTRGGQVFILDLPVPPTWDNRPACRSCGDPASVTWDARPLCGGCARFEVDPLAVLDRCFECGMDV